MLDRGKLRHRGAKAHHWQSPISQAPATATRCNVALPHGWGEPSWLCWAMEEEAKGGGLVPATPGEDAPCGEGRTEPGTEVPAGSPHGWGSPAQEGELIQCLGWKH